MLTIDPPATAGGTDCVQVQVLTMQTEFRTLQTREALIEAVYQQFPLGVSLM